MKVRVRNGKVIGVDVDLTVVNSDLAWFDWLGKLCNDDRTFEEMWEDGGMMPYNLSTLFDIPEGKDPFDFWRQEDLYDNLWAMPRSSEVLKVLYEMGYDIVFVSYCFDCGSHAQSKVRLLRREFPFIPEKDFHFVQTRSKGVLTKSLDYMVDDRFEFLNQMKGGVECILFESPYVQDDMPTRDYKVADNWYQVLQIITKNPWWHHIN